MHEQDAERKDSWVFVEDEARIELHCVGFRPVFGVEDKIWNREIYLVCFLQVVVARFLFHEVYPISFPPPSHPVRQVELPHRFGQYVREHKFL